MSRAPLMLSAIALVSLAACAQTSGPMVSTRGTPSEIAAPSSSQSETVLASQANALTQMTQGIVRKSTINGAALGALAGCGLVVLSASNASNCLTGVVVGGAVGAAAGAAHGKAQVAKRVQLVSPSALVRSIGKATDQMDSVKTDLPTVLAQQDAELAALNAQLKNGQVTSDVVAKRHTEIAAIRAELAEALSLTAAQASTAHDNLKSAEAEGQTGLDWHMSATQSLVREATSARSMITLL